MESNKYQLTLEDKKVLMAAQKNFGFSTMPFDEIAKRSELDVENVMKIMQNLSKEGFITRTGPFFNLDRSSGYVSLVAMRVPEDRFVSVANLINSYQEVAHNYKRKHDLNMWFVLGAISKESAFKILEEIEEKTKLKTYNLPKLKEYNLDLFLEV